jgi:hypothetical protein
VFVVGALDETVMLRGMRYHPIDIENSVMRCHKKIAEWWVISMTLCQIQDKNEEARTVHNSIAYFIGLSFHLLVV